MSAYSPCPRAESFVYSYLTMTSGSRQGVSYALDPADENRIGRGVDCTVVLNDALCSRVHAIVLRHSDGWRIRDLDSRNGTYVNDQKIDEATIVDGNRIRMGSSEFLFRVTDQPPTVETPSGIGITQTILKNLPISGRDIELNGLAAITDSRQAQELLLLYQLAIKHLGCADPDEIIRVSIELLREWTKATVAGFLWITDDGQLKPKLLTPANAASRATLSKSLTEMVCRQGNAVWINNQKAGPQSQSLQHYADALCVPLVHNGKIMGAVHVYLDRGRFHQSDFDFAISLANITAVALQRARREQSLSFDLKRLAVKNAQLGEMVGDSKPMLELKARIEKIGRATGCVLVRGESGAGKELVARAIHRASPRADRPMLCVNCAAIPANLVESQLFGHKAGAFTSADRDHVGYFQQADLGTLFLDEIGELPLEGQAKLLRILEGHPFLPVGATKEVTVDVRVIAATNQDLQQFVKEKKFREDLYYRLSVFELHVPPLRERGADIGVLLDHFLEHFARQHGRQGLSLSPAARKFLLEYSWPGNVRQLRNVIDGAVILADGDAIETSDLGIRDMGSEVESLRLDYWERRLIGEALRRTNHNIAEAAELLGIGRATLYRKIDEFGMKAGRS